MLQEYAGTGRCMGSAMLVTHAPTHILRINGEFLPAAREAAQRNLPAPVALRKQEPIPIVCASESQREWGGKERAKYFSYPQGSPICLQQSGGDEAERDFPFWKKGAAACRMFIKGASRFGKECDHVNIPWCKFLQKGD